METIRDRTWKNDEYSFDEVNHLHTLDGKALTGVTTVLSVIAKPALIQWAANMACDFIETSFANWTQDKDSVFDIKTVCKEARTAHKKKKETAGTWGTELHAEIEEIIKNAVELTGGFIPAVSTKTPELEKFTTWATENKVRFISSEKHVYSRELWVGGIADIVCEIDGKLYVGDIKTSSGIYPEHYIQCSAYAMILLEMAVFPKMCDGVVVINIDKKGGFQVKQNYDLLGNFETFKAALKIYRHMQAIK